MGEFGVAYPLDVFVRRGGGSVRFEHAANDDAEFQGFYQGVWAAEECLLRQGTGTAQEAVWLQSHSVRGVIPGLPRRLEVVGASLGLSSAMATVSAFLRLPIPSEVAFTGRVDPRGRIHPVRGIELKLRAAHDKGVRRVFVPAETREAFTSGLDGALEVAAVAAVDDVVSRLWPAEMVRTALGDFNRPAPDSAVPDDAIESRALRRRGRRVLLTAVGKADPFGQYLDRRRLAMPGDVTEEGPILTVCRWLRPDAVYLLYTTGPDDRNDFTGHAQRVERIVAEMLPACAVSRRALAAIADPSDYQQIVPEFTAAVSDIVAREPRAPAEFLVNLSSGSPQMETAWYLLKAWRIVPARLLQVREARFVDAQHARLREVVLPEYR